MLNIICLITVTVMAPIDKNVYVPWMVQEQVRGHIIKQDEESYLVDFSKEASEKKYVGDYKERMVQKFMCMKL
jgi:hypothetical protein